MPKHSSSYTHYFEPAKPDAAWPDGYTFTQIKSLEELKDALWSKDGAMAVDTETRSLLHHENSIVGFSFCHAKDDRVGYYVPIGHDEGAEENLPYKEALDLLVARMKDHTTIYYNYIFDVRQIEAQGYDLNPKLGYRYIDAAIYVWLADTNHGSPKLKWAEQHFLGWGEVITFEDVLGDAATAAAVPPSLIATYAAADAIGTMRLANVLVPGLVKECGEAAKIDNAFLYPMMKWMETVIDMDVDVLAKVESDTQKEALELKRQIFAQAVSAGIQLKTTIPAKTKRGKPKDIYFDPNSSRDVLRLFEALGVDTGHRSPKTNRMSTSAKAVESCTHPIAQTVVAYRKCEKSKNSYSDPLRRAAISGNCRFSYKMTQASTGRLAGGNEDENSWFAHVNIQGITKPKSRQWFVVPEGVEPDPAEGPVCNVLGNRLVMAPKKPDQVALLKNEGHPLYTHWAEGADTAGNIRRAFTCPPGYLWFSPDYSGEEARIAANLSGERNWIKAFMSGGDIHTMTCIALFGRMDKDLRKIAKIFNFAVIYGAGPYGLAAQTGRSVRDKIRIVSSPVIPPGQYFAEDYFGKATRIYFSDSMTDRDPLLEIKRSEWATMGETGRVVMEVEGAKTMLARFQRENPELFSYINSLKAIARQRGVVYTHFQRPRRLRYWYSQDPNTQEGRKLRSYADRCAFNTTIQGVAGDILKIALTKIYWEVYEPNVGDILWRSTVHDEVNFLIREEKFMDLAPKIIHIMRMKIAKWPVPLEVGISIGTSWGSIFPFKFEGGNFTLDAEPFKKEVTA